MTRGSLCAATMSSLWSTRGQRARGTAFLAIAVLLASLLAPAAPASADVTDVRTRGTTRLLDGITHTRIEVELTGGARARGDLLRFRPGAAGLEMRPVSGRGVVAGVEPMSSLAKQELARGALAGVNGGYWLNRPTGAPNGLHIEDGRLFAGDSVNRSGNPVGRGVVGISEAGALVMDRLGVSLSLDFPELAQDAVEISEINRQVRTSTDGTLPVDGELLLFDENYGTSFSVPGGSTLVVVDELALGSSGRQAGVVRDVRRPTNDTSFRVPEGTSVLLEYGDSDYVRALDDVAVGMSLGVAVTVSPYTTAAAAWEDLAGALAGGGLLIRDGQRRSVDEWRQEAFSESHITGRQPRTAIAHDADGRVMLLTIDGRQSGWSDGVTYRELADVLLSLGAVDALNLDGGGSTTMTVNGAIRNRPSEHGRSIANALFVYAPPPPGARGLDRACPERTPRAGYEDTRGTIHEASIDCLAWWEVTSGVTETSYEPNTKVTRAQMASFLAQWVDDIAERGNGRPLPSDPQSSFEDVSKGNAHERNITRLADAGILGGKKPGIFDPYSPVTRAQTASLIRAAVQYSTGTAIPDARDTFIDDAGNIHEDAIDALAHLGVITGVGGFSYAPESDVTRGSMSALVMRASDHLVETGTVTPPS